MKLSPWSGTRAAGASIVTPAGQRAAPGSPQAGEMFPRPPPGHRTRFCPRDRGRAASGPRAAFPWVQVCGPEKWGRLWEGRGDGCPERLSCSHRQRPPGLAGLPNGLRVPVYRRSCVPHCPSLSPTPLVSTEAGGAAALMVGRMAAPGTPYRRPTKSIPGGSRGKVTPPSPPAGQAPGLWSRGHQAHEQLVAASGRPGFPRPRPLASLPARLEAGFPAAPSPWTGPCPVFWGV